MADSEWTAWVEVTTSTAHVRTVTDELGATDDAARGVAHVRTVTDELGATDDAARGVAHHRTVTDDLGLVDAAAAGESAAHERTITDDLGLSDDATADHQVGGITHERSVTDQLGASDTALGFHHEHGWTEWVTVTTDPPGALSRSLVDPLGLTDLGVVGPVEGERMGLADSGAWAMGGDGDTAGITDQVSYQLFQTTEFARTIVDQLGLTDVGSFGWASDRDRMGLTDTVTYLHQKMGGYVLTDAVGLVDSGQAVKDTDEFTPDVSLTDTVAARRQLARTVVDSLGIVDVATADLIGNLIARTIADQLGIDDTVEDSTPPPFRLIGVSRHREPDDSTSHREPVDNSGPAPSHLYPGTGHTYTESKEPGKTSQHHEPKIATESEEP